MPEPKSTRRSATVLEAVLTRRSSHHEGVVGMGCGIRRVVHHTLDVAFLELPGVEIFDYSERHDCSLLTCEIETLDVTDCSAKSCEEG